MDQAIETLRSRGGTDAAAAVMTIEAAMEAIAQTNNSNTKYNNEIRPSSIFAALLVALERAEATQAEPILYALDTVLPCVPGSVIRNHWQTLRRLFSSVMAGASEMNQEGKSLKRTVSAMGTAMRCLDPSPEFWLDTDTLAAFMSILALCISTDASIRRTAQQAVVKILQRHKHNKKSSVQTKTSEFIQQVLQEASVKSTQRSLMILVFCRTALPHLFPSLLADCLEAVLGLLGIGQTIFSLATLRTLNALIESPKVQFSSDLLMNLVRALVDLAPNPDDPAVAAVYSPLLASTLIRLATNEVDQAGKDGGAIAAAASGATALQRFTMASDETIHSDTVDIPAHVTGRDWTQDMHRQTTTLLVSVIQTLCQYFISQRVSVHVAAANSIASIVLSCFSAPLLRQAVSGDQVNSNDVVHRSLSLLTTLLDYKYQSAWSITMPLFSLLAYHFGPQASPLMDEIVTKLITLRNALIDASDEASDRRRKARFNRKKYQGRTHKKQTKPSNHGKDKRDESDEEFDDSTHGGTVTLVQRMILRILARFLRSVGPQQFLALVPFVSPTVQEQLRATQAAALSKQNTEGFKDKTPTVSFADSNGIGSATLQTSSVIGASPGVSDDRLWVIKLLSENVKYAHKSSLQFFMTHILEAARKCETAANAAHAHKLYGNAKTFRSRALQLWMIFPSICISATDVSIAFTDNFGKLLASAIQDNSHPQLCGIIASGLEVLISRNRRMSGQGDYTRPTLLGSSAKNGDTSDMTSTVGGLTMARGDGLSFVGGATMLRAGGASIFGGAFTHAGGPIEGDSDEEDEDAAVFGGARRQRRFGGDETTLMGDDAEMTTGGRSVTSRVQKSDKQSNDISGPRHPALLAVMGVGGMLPTWTTSHAEQQLQAVKRLASKFLPILFNVYETNAKCLSTNDEQETDMSATNLKRNALQRLLYCIGAYTSIAPHNLVQSMMERLMGFIDHAIADVGTAAIEATQEATQSGAVSGDSQKQLKRVIATSNKVLQLVSRVSALFSLSLCMIPLCSKESAQILYTTIRPTIVDDTIGTLQKRAYHVLLALLTHQPEQFILNQEQRQDVAELLRSSLLSVSASAKRIRLRCLDALMSQIKVVISTAVSETEDQNQISALGQAEMEALQLVPRLIGEIMLCTKEANRKTRTIAFDVLISMSYAYASPVLVGNKESFNEKEEEDASITGDQHLDGARLVEFIQLVAAGLAGTTVHMQAASILALSRLLYEFNEVPELQQTLEELMNTIFLLLRTNVREVVKSVVSSVRVIIAVFPPALIEPLVPTILSGIFAPMIDVQHKKKLRGKLRIILEKLMRKFGYEMLDASMPEQDKPLLKHIQRMRARKQRKRDTIRGVASAEESAKTVHKKRNGTDKAITGRTGSTSAQTTVDAFDDLVDSEEEDEDLMTQATGLTLAPSRAGNSRIGTRIQSTSVMSSNRQQKSKADMAPASWIRADVDAMGEGNPLDLLDTANATRSIVGTDPLELAKWKRKRAKDAQKVATLASESTKGAAARHAVAIASDGRIIVNDFDSDEDGMHSGNGDSSSEDDDEENETKRNNRVKKGFNEEEGRTLDSGEGWGLSSRTRAERQRRQKANANATNQISGATYKSRRAKGDVQRRGQKLEPFAYVPLDPRQLSAKGNARSVARFAGVSQAKKGVASSAMKRTRSTGRTSGNKRSKR